MSTSATEKVHQIANTGVLFHTNRRRVSLGEYIQHMPILKVRAADTGRDRLTWQPHLCFGSLMFFDRGPCLVFRMAQRFDRTIGALGLSCDAQIPTVMNHLV